MIEPEVKKKPVNEEELSVEERITITATKINNQIQELAEDRKCLALNVMILPDGRVYQVENYRYLQMKVEDDETKMRDMLRHLDELIKERDGVGESDN